MMKEERISAQKKKFYFCTNTKMYKNLHQTVCYLEHLLSLIQDIGQEEMELTVMPSYTALDAARKRIPQGKVLLGAQNVCWEETGEVTGEISASMLKELGVELVMLGHSERRLRFQEEDTQINKKVHAVLQHGMTVLLSVSETQEDRDCGISDEVLRIQIKRGLKGVSKESIHKLRILYEPAWAVGNGGTTASAEYVRNRHRAVRECLSELYGETGGRQIPIIYGGSVTMENACSLIVLQNVDGLGIGRNAWDAENFNRIIRKAMQAYKANHHGSLPEMP